MDLIRTNDQDHETRILAVEAASVNERVFDHFNRTDGTPTGLDDTVWVQEQSGGAPASTVGTTLHQLVMNVGASANHWTRLTSKQKFRPADRPLFICRFEQSASANLQPLLVGLQEDRTITTDAPPDGAYFLKPTGADSNTVCEVALASSTTQSSIFGIKGNGLMREVIIDYVATNRVVITVDGTERLDLTDGDVPRAQEEVYAMIHWHSTTVSAQTVFIDRISCVAQDPQDVP